MTLNYTLYYIHCIKSLHPNFEDIMNVYRLYINETNIQSFACLLVRTGINYLMSTINCVCTND